MIFEETEEGMVIHIRHHDMMYMDTEEFLGTILMGRHLYRSHVNADVDDDDSEEN